MSNVERPTAESLMDKSYRTHYDFLTVSTRLAEMYLEPFSVFDGEETISAGLQRPPELQKVYKVLEQRWHAASNELGERALQHLSIQ